jgi:hypothetical protein
MGSAHRKQTQRERRLGQHQLATVMSRVGSLRRPGMVERPNLNDQRGVEMHVELFIWPAMRLG